MQGKRAHGSVRVTGGDRLSSQDRSSPEVLIVGAGPTGLTLACELARHGISFRICEAAAGPQLGSRGKGIQPRTLELFGDLGISDRVIANGRMAMPICSTAPSGDVTWGGAAPVALMHRPDIPYTTSLITPEWRIEEALRRALGEFGGEVEFDTLFKSLEQSDESVSVLIEKDGEMEALTARWLVGCDGGHSLVRKQSGIAFVGETREDVRMIVADVEVQGFDREAWYMWRHLDGLVGLCPLPSTSLFQYQASIAPGQDPELSVANMQAILERRTGRSDIRLGDPEWSSLWGANIRLVDRYRDGRVFLAGDAAHIHSPFGGQGMNTGIQDSFNLGWKLAAVATGASSALLDSYELERRPIAAGVLSLSSDRLEQVLDKKDNFTQRDASTIQLDIGYRDTELAKDDRDVTALLRAGDRAPDATGLLTAAGDHRLFSLIGGGRFTLLEFGTSNAINPFSGVLRILHVGRRLDSPHDVVDTEGQLARIYGASGRTLVLIRPDGYIGLISDAGDYVAVLDYLSTIYGLSSNAKRLD